MQSSQEFPKFVQELQTQHRQQLQAAIENAIELAYWEFDAQRNSKEKSERDIFKAVVRRFTYPLLPVTTPEPEMNVVFDHTFDLTQKKNGDPWAFLNEVIEKHLVHVFASNNPEDTLNIDGLNLLINSPKFIYTPTSKIPTNVRAVGMDYDSNAIGATRAKIHYEFTGSSVKPGQTPGDLIATTINWHLSELKRDAKLRALDDNYRPEKPLNPKLSVRLIQKAD